MKRDLLLAHIRIAGYHGDRATYTRLYIENRISQAAAAEAFRAGIRQRETGVPCSCSECTRS